MNKVSTTYTKSIEFAALEALPPEDPPFWTKTAWLQLGYGIWVNLTLMNIGLCLEFPAVAIPQLKDDESDIQMTKREEAMIASVLILSSPIGCILAGILLDRCGRKAGLIMCQIPIAIGWLYMAFAKYASGIILGRVICGIGIGMAMVAPRAYIAEITLPNMRGVLGAIPNLSISTGLTIQAVLGTYSDWRFLCYVCAGYSTILLCANLLLPDTPYFILLQSTASHARVALKRFRSSRFNLEGELQTLQEFKTVNNIRSLTLCETKKAMFKTSACKPFGIILSYFTLSQLVGVNVVTTWAVEMLQLSHSSIDPHWGNVSLSVTRMVVGLASSYLLYKAGRRPVALMSAAGVGGMGIILGGYLHTQEGGRSPLILMLGFVAFAVPGYHTLPMMMMFELLPLQIRGILSGVILSIANIQMFAAITAYPTLRDTIGIANTFTIYGIISFLGTIVLYFILPETKELTLQEIEEYFNRRRSTLISERRLMSIQLQSQRLSTLKDTSQLVRESSKFKKKKVSMASTADVSIKRKPSSDMIIVYDEDEINTKINNEDSREKVKKETNIKASSNKKRNSVEEDVIDSTEKSKEDKTEQKETKKENLKKDLDKRDKTEQDTTEKENVEIKKDDSQEKADPDKPSTSGT